MNILGFIAVPHQAPAYRLDYENRGELGKHDTVFKGDHDLNSYIIITHLIVLYRIVDRYERHQLARVKMLATDWAKEIITEWENKMIGLYDLDFLLKHSDDLEELAGYLNRYESQITDFGMDLSDLPNWGGEKPDDTTGIYSWDSDSYLIHIDNYGWMVEDRESHDEQRKENIISKEENHA